MFTLPCDACDDDFGQAVSEWFRLVASGAIEDAQEFLDTQGSPDSMHVRDFISRVAELTSGGTVTTPETIPRNIPPEELPVDGLVDIVCRWIPGPKTTEKHPGFIADILHTIPVDGKWSDVAASFFIRCDSGILSLQLRDVIRCDDS